MAARLPTVGGDDGTWGSVLNTFLGVSHNADGTLNPDVVPLPTGAADETTLAAASAKLPAALASNGGMKVELASALMSTADSVQAMSAPGVASVIHANARYITDQTGAAIYTPTSGKKVVVTNCRISSRGTTAGQITVWISASAANDTTFTTATDIAIADDDYAPSATSKPGSKSGSVFIPAPAINYPICVTSTGGVSYTVMLELFEV